MPAIDITEYDALARDNLGGTLPTGQEPGIDQSVAISAGATQSAAFNSNTRFVRVHADLPCRILFGSNPTASAGNGKRIGAGGTEYFGVRPGHKVSVIATT